MRTLAWIALLTAACTGHVGEDGLDAEVPEAGEQTAPELDAQPAPEPGPAAVTFDGLELSLEYTGKRRVEPGVRLEPRWRLRNTADAPRTFVQSADGSEVGWREPHVYYTAQHSLDGETWTDVESGDLGRCGMYDNDWHDEIATLTPGESVELAWTPDPGWQLRLQQPGRVRVWAHYVFSAGAGFGDGRGASEDLAQMQGVPAFHLISAPLELEIVRPIDLVLRAKPRAGRATRLSQAFELTLENHGAAARTLPLPNATNVRVLARRGDEQSALQDPEWERHERQAELALSRGESVSVLGDDLDFELPAELWSDALEINVRLELGAAAGHLETGWVRASGG